MLKKKEKITANVCAYINEQKVRWGLFMRPVSTAQKFVFANKYSVITIDFNKYPIKISIINKFLKKEDVFVVKYTAGIMFFSEFTDTLKGVKEFFIKLFSDYSYDTTAENVIYKIKSFEWRIAVSGLSEIKEKLFEKAREIVYEELSLDINQASEAELTALPGVTIAKAKRAIKMRNKYAFYLTMNQFYEAINLDEEFIEQIKTNGNKILLNELPEYKRLEMREE